MGCSYSLLSGDTCIKPRLMSRVACVIPFALFRFLYMKIMNTRWVVEDWWSQHDM